MTPLRKKRTIKGVKTVFIYVLKDPATKEIRYVGKSDSPRQRLSAHISSVRVEKYRKANWIRSLLARGLRPILEIEDECAEDVWPSIEAAYIQFFREKGCRLTNTTEGGDAGPNNRGCKQKPRSEQWRENQRKAQTGKTHQSFSPEHCEKIGEALRGRSFTAEHRENISRSTAGKSRPAISKTHREAISRHNKGVPKTEAHKENLRKAWIKRKEKLCP